MTKLCWNDAPAAIQVDGPTGSVVAASPEAPEPGAKRPGPALNYSSHGCTWRINLHARGETKGCTDPRCSKVRRRGTAKSTYRPLSLAWADKSGPQRARWAQH
jgi:hypothetical protein